MGCTFVASVLSNVFSVASTLSFYNRRDEDGNKGIDFAKDLNDILNIRKAESCNSAKLSAEII